MNEPKQRLSRAEAEGLVALINRNFENIAKQGVKAKEMLTRFLDGDGWKTLGYASINECVRARFPWSERTFWREFEAIDVSRRLGLTDDTLLTVQSVSALRSLPDDRMKEAWDAATGGQPDVKPTAAQVKEAVRQIQEQEAAKEPPAAGAPPEPAATTEVTIVGREPGDDDEEVEETYLAEPEVSPEDEEREFAEGLPLIGKLPSHLEKRYVADALAWKRLEHARRAYLVALRGQAAFAKKVCASVTPPYLDNQIFGVGKRGAHEWRLCADCDGKGRRFVADRSTACSSCQTHGYRT